MNGGMKIWLWNKIVWASPPPFEKSWLRHCYLWTERVIVQSQFIRYSIIDRNIVSFPVKTIAFCKRFENSKHLFPVGSFFHRASFVKTIINSYPAFPCHVTVVRINGYVWWWWLNIMQRSICLRPYIWIYEYMNTRTYRYDIRG